MSRALADAAMDCVTCPRLCRDVCPVAVQAERDDLVPSELMRSVAAAFGRPGLRVDPERLRACTGCGACGAHCLLAIPLPSWLAAAREAAGVDIVHDHFDIAGHGRAAGSAAAAVAVAAVALADAAVACCGEVPALAASATGLDPAARRALVARPQLPAPVSGAPALRPPAGATCCGARLDPRVGDPGLRARMAAAMIDGLLAAGAREGATVAVADAACAAWLQQNAAGRLRFVAASPAPAADDA